MVDIADVERDLFDAGDLEVLAHLARCAHSGDRLLSEPTAGTRLVGGIRSSCPKADVADGKRAAIVTALRQAIDRDCYPCRRG